MAIWVEVGLTITAWCLGACWEYNVPLLTPCTAVHKVEARSYGVSASCGCCCHMRAPLKVVRLWVLVAAFCSLSRASTIGKGSQRLHHGLLLSGNWHSLVVQAVTVWKVFLESIQAALEVPATTTTTQDIRLGSVGGPGWRHVVPRSTEVRIPTTSVVDENPLQVR